MGEEVIGGIREDRVIMGGDFGESEAVDGLQGIDL